MPITRIHSFLVHPSKSEEEQPVIGGVQLPLRGPVHEMLSRLYADAERECNIDIVFRPTNGRQSNPCRDLVLSYLRSSTLHHGRAFASRLQAVTTHRSGLGLFFVVRGAEGGNHRLILARFPADEGIVAHEHAQQLDVEFLERVFLKSAHAYKSVVYVGPSLNAGFWEGRAVDRQISTRRELSMYWIGDFLDSELKATPAAGTKRLALALRKAIQDAATPAIRNELMAATHLVPGHAGRRESPAQIVAGLGLGDDAARAVREAFPRPEIFDEVFELDREEFQRHLLYRFVQLDNGATLVGENERFDHLFVREEVVAPARAMRFTTVGNVVGQELRTSI